MAHSTMENYTATKNRHFEHIVWIKGKYFIVNNTYIKYSLFICKTHCYDNLSVQSFNNFIVFQNPPLTSQLLDF